MVVVAMVTLMVTLTNSQFLRPLVQVGVPSTGKLEKDLTLLMDPQILKTCLMLSEQDVVKY